MLDFFFIQRNLFFINFSLYIKIELKTPRVLKESSVSEPSSITASSSLTTASSLKTFPSQQSNGMEAMEKAFHALRSEYDRCLGKPDYKEHMKVSTRDYYELKLSSYRFIIIIQQKLEREMKKLEGEINSILSDIKT